MARSHISHYLIVDCKLKQNIRNSNKNSDLFLFFAVFVDCKSPYSKRLWRSIIHERAEITTDMSMAMTKPKRFSSMPFMRFMPKNEEMSVGNIIMIDTEVSVRITVFMLLLIMDE